MKERKFVTSANLSNGQYFIFDNIGQKGVGVKLGSFSYVVRDAKGVGQDPRLVSICARLIRPTGKQKALFAAELLVLKSEARELIRAARIPPTTIPVNPFGSNSFTSVEKAASLLARLNKGCPVDGSIFCVRAKAIIPGIRNMNTGVNFRKAPKMVPLLACF